MPRWHAYNGVNASVVRTKIERHAWFVDSVYYAMVVAI